MLDIRSGRMNPGKWVALGLFLLVVWLYGVNLGVVPSGVTNDELEYLLSSKSYALSGQDISGYAFPESLFNTKTEGRTSFVPVFVLSLLYRALPLDSVVVNWLYTGLILGSGILVYMVARRFRGSELVAGVVGL